MLFQSEEARSMSLYGLEKLDFMYFLRLVSSRQFRLFAITLKDTISPFQKKIIIMNANRINYFD